MIEKYSKSSAILSIVCAFTLFLSYELAPDQPEGSVVILLQVLFFTSIITGLMSLIFSFLAYKKNEEGFLKKIAPVILFSIMGMLGIYILGIIVSFM